MKPSARGVPPGGGLVAEERATAARARPEPAGGATAAISGEAAGGLGPEASDAMVGERSRAAMGAAP